MSANVSSESLLKAQLSAIDSTALFCIRLFEPVEHTFIPCVALAVRLAMPDHIGFSSACPIKSVAGLQEPGVHRIFSTLQIKGTWQLPNLPHKSFSLFILQNGADEPPVGSKPYWSRSIRLLSVNGYHHHYPPDDIDRTMKYCGSQDGLSGPSARKVSITVGEKGARDEGRCESGQHRMKQCHH